ncbi:hypothetical protein [Planotetraspora silvatica]|nr:hypothetical protein [Planotetraspora silvatica]
MSFVLRQTASHRVAKTLPGPSDSRWQKSDTTLPGGIRRGRSACDLLRPRKVEDGCNDQPDSGDEYSQPEDEHLQPRVILKQQVAEHRQQDVGTDGCRKVKGASERVGAALWGDARQLQLELQLERL